MRLTAYKRPEAFLVTASPLLLQDEARHNLVFGVCATLMEAPATYPNFGLWIVEDAGEIVGAEPVVARSAPTETVTPGSGRSSLIEGL
jgi:hypothetical protein